MNACFEIKRAKNNEYYFTLVATNGQIIATSEMYTTKQNAKVGIESVKANTSVATVRDCTEKL